MADSQADIYDIIYRKEHNRNQIIAPTQYGKSSIVAIALIDRMYYFGDRFAIVTGSEPKSQIIMRKVIEHIFDDGRILSQLDIDAKMPLDRLRRERSQKRITFKNGGEVETFTADARNRQKVKESLMGFGSPNIIEDESSLIFNDLQVMVMRMLGGYGGGFLVKIGNPTYRNHFHKTWHSPRYKKVFIDYIQALKEGRYTQEFIEEMQDEPFFDMLYACKFPEPDEIDNLGYRILFKSFKLGKKEHSGELRMGFDVGEGVDINASILRSDSFAEIVHISKISDLMATARECMRLIDDFKIKHENFFIDRIGIGGGVYARLVEKGYNVTGIKWSMKPKDERYLNLKAENFFETQRWLKKGGVLNKEDDWSETEVIRWKEDTGGRLKIKTKEELRREGIPSPNIMDALALSFNPTIIEEAPEIHVL